MTSMNDPEIVKPQIPRLPAEELDYISVCHPKHDRSFLLFGCRTQRGTSRAISRILVHQAATIVSQTDGYLSLSREAGHAISADALIPAGQYYFHSTDDNSADYSICADFDAWVPPTGPDALPEPWRTLAQAYQPNVQSVNCNASDFAGWVKGRDVCCFLTGNEDLVECQHLVPQEHFDWASQHDILHRATQSRIPYPPTVRRDIDDVRFLITMNPFAYHLMDKGRFAPFPLTIADDTIAYVAYFFSTTMTVSSSEYHCCTLDMPSRIPPYLLYVRFAWTVIKFLVRHDTAPIARKPLPDWCSMSVHRSGRGGGSGISGHRAPSLMSDIAGSNVSVDDLEMRERLLPPGVLEIFSAVDAGKTEPPELLWEYGMDYPGMARIGRLREEYMKQHPEVSCTGDPSTLKLV